MSSESTDTLIHTQSSRVVCQCGTWTLNSAGGNNTVSWTSPLSTVSDTHTISPEMLKDGSYKPLGALQALHCKCEERCNRVLADIFKDSISLYTKRQIVDITGSLPAPFTCMTMNTLVLKAQPTGEESSTNMKSRTVSMILCLSRSTTY